MRLKISRVAAEERLIAKLNEGYRLHRSIWDDYQHRVNSDIYDPDSDNDSYYASVNGWCKSVGGLLLEVFPTDLESNIFQRRGSHQSYSYDGINQIFGRLFYTIFPDYIERLRRIHEVDLFRYTDLPLHDRLFVEDVDSFRCVRDVNPALVTDMLDNGFLNRTEDQVQLALEQILDVSFHRRDWGGEINDLYTANLIVNGSRRATAFLLKGPGVGRKEMTIAQCGKNGDQLIRLFSTPAELFIIQSVGPIADLLIKDVQGKVSELRSHGRQAHFLIMDGQDTARVLYAYGKLHLPLEC